MNDVFLMSIPKEEYQNFRYRVIFEGCKWDPQVGDENTIADEVVILSAAAAHKLCTWAEALAAETVQLEQALLKKPELFGELALPRVLQKALQESSRFDPTKHVRLMRFDFHPTFDGWAVSEVNSDVPGGLAEASVLPKVVSELLPEVKPMGNVAGAIADAFKSIVGSGLIGLVHATAYSDDRQVMEFLGQELRNKGLKTALIAPDHVRWYGDRATSIAEGQEGELAGLARFFPAEWLCELPKAAAWQNYFLSNLTACNHPVALLTQSKRLPLLWDKLAIPIPTWRDLLPETVDPRFANLQSENWILKPCLGRVGEGVTIPSVISKKELRSIMWDARLFPKDWVAQRRFNSLSLKSNDNTERHLCIGVFTVQGRAAGFYGRVSSRPRIDASAKDIAVLVSKEGGV